MKWLLKKSISKEYFIFFILFQGNQQSNPIYKRRANKKKYVAKTSILKSNQTRTQQTEIAF